MIIKNIRIPLLCYFRVSTQDRRHTIDDDDKHTIDEKTKTKIKIEKERI